MSRLPTIHPNTSSLKQKKPSYNFIVNNRRLNNSKKDRSNKQKVDLIDLYRNTKTILNSKLMNETEHDYNKYMELYNQLKTEPGLIDYFKDWNFDIKTNDQISLNIKNNNISNKDKNLPAVGNLKPLKVLFKDKTRKQNFKLKYADNKKIDGSIANENKLAINRLIKTKLPSYEHLAAKNVQKSFFINKTDLHRMVSKSKFDKIYNSQVDTKHFVSNIAQRNLRRSQINNKYNSNTSISHFNNNRWSFIRQFNDLISSNMIKVERKFLLDYDITGNFNDFYHFLLYKKNKIVYEEKEQESEGFSLLELPDPKFSKLEPEVQQHVKKLTNLSKVEKLIYKDISIRLNKLSRGGNKHERIIKKLLSPPFTLVGEKRSSSVLKFSKKNKDKIQRFSSCINLKITESMQSIKKTSPFLITEEPQIEVNRVSKLTNSIFKEKFKTPIIPCAKINNPNQVLAVSKHLRSKNKSKSSKLPSVKFIDNNSEREQIENNSYAYIPTICNTNKENEICSKTTLKTVGSTTGYGILINKNIKSFQKISNLGQKTIKNNSESNASLHGNDLNMDSIWINLIRGLRKEANLRDINIIGYYTTTKIVNKSFFDIFLEHKEKRIWNEAVNHRYNDKNNKSDPKKNLECIKKLMTKIKVDIAVNDYILKKVDKKIIVEDNNDAEDFD